MKKIRNLNFRKISIFLIIGVLCFNSGSNFFQNQKIKANTNKEVFSLSETAESVNSKINIADLKDFSHFKFKEIIAKKINDNDVKINIPPKKAKVCFDFKCRELLKIEELRNDFSLKKPLNDLRFRRSSRSSSTPIIEYYNGIEDNIIENLLFYLSLNQNENGSWGNYNQYEITGEIALILSQYNLTDSDQYNLAINYLINTVPKNNKEKAIKARLMFGLGEDYQYLLNELILDRSSDGGIGLSKNYPSDLDTTLELTLAFWVVNQGIEDIVPQGLYHILNKVQGDGSIFYFNDNRPSYYLINKTLHYLEPFQSMTVGDVNNRIVIQDKINLLNNYLLNNYNTENNSFNNTDIIDELMSLYSWQIYDIENEKQDLLFNKLKNQQSFDGSFGNSFLANIFALKSLRQSDLELTNVDNVGDLINNSSAVFALTIKNKGYRKTKNVYLNNFINDFKFNNGYDLSAQGFVLNPQEEIIINITFDSSTRKFLGDTEIKFYIQDENEFNYNDNWISGEYIFLSSLDNIPAIPLYYTAQKTIFNNLPAVALKWPERDDSQRYLYVFLYRPVGSQWSVIGINNSLDNYTVHGFPEGSIYEIALGVVHNNGSTISYTPSDIHTIQMSSDPNAYLGNVSGFISENNNFLSGMEVSNDDLSLVSNQNGNFFSSNLVNGSHILSINETQYQSLKTKFLINVNSTTTDIALFTHLKEDNISPIINNLKILNEDDLVVDNQQEVEISLTAQDNVVLKNADFYYFNSEENIWLYLGSQNFNDSNSVILPWYVSENLQGSDYRLRAVVWDYQDNYSEIEEWGPFTIQNNPLYTYLNCGDVINESIILGNNLSCSSTALIIGLNDITLNCNGRSIIGNNEGNNSGIKISNLENVRIENCNISGFEKGIYLDKGMSHNIIGNNLFANASGIHLAYESNSPGSTSNNITNNYIHNNTSYGIYLGGGSNGNIINNNEVLNNDGGGAGAGIRIDWSDNNTVSNNNINGNNAYGLAINQSDFNIVDNNIIQNNHEEGIFIKASDDNEIKNNNILENECNGILLRGYHHSLFDGEVENNIIHHNNIENNASSCWYVEEYNDSSFGIKSDEYSVDNEFYANDFINNFLQVEDLGTNNIWNSITIGNYWSDNDCVDILEPLGICDDVYLFNNNQDNLPTLNLNN